MTKEEKRFTCQITIRGCSPILIGSGGSDVDEESALKSAYDDILGALKRARKEQVKTAQAAES